MNIFLTNNIIKKLVAIFVMAGLVLPGNIIFAQGGVVTDPGNTALNAANLSQTTTTSVNTTLNTIKTLGLDQIAFALASFAGEKIAQKIINKNNGGASRDGNPDYVQNFNSLFDSTTDSEIQKMLVSLTNTNNPYADQIARDMVASRAAETRPGANPLNGFNLDKIIGPKWQNFQNDAKVGGWQGYMAIALPQNNPYGSRMLAGEQLARNITSQLEAEKTRLISPGIRPQGKCNLDLIKYSNRVEQASVKIKATNSSDAKDAERSDIINTLSAKIASDQSELEILQNRKNTITTKINASKDPSEQELLQTDLEDINKKIESLNSSIKSNGDKIKNSKTFIETKAAVQSGKLALGSLAADSIVEDIGCLEELITNPAAVSESVLSSAVNLGLNKTNNVKGFGDLIAGTLLQMANGFLKAGGLSSLTSDAGLKTKNIGGIEDTKTKLGGDLPWNQQPRQIIDLSQELPPAYRNTVEELGYIKTSLDNIKKTPTKLSDLDQCIPGPDYQANKRLKAYFDQKTSKIKNDFAANIIDASTEVIPQAVTDSLDDGYKLASREMSDILNKAEYQFPGGVFMRQAVTEFDSKKKKFDKLRQDLVDRTYSLTTILGLTAKIKDGLATVTPKRPFHVGPDKFVIISSDWDALTAAEKTAAVNWAKSYEN